MSSPKRYDPINSDGTCGTCVEDPDYGAYVEFADYAALHAEAEALRDCAKRIDAYWQSELRDGRKERDALAAELATARRVIDRIGQLCTTPHESKERFIRRVQSVIEWERAAQQDQPQ